MRTAPGWRVARPRLPHACSSPLMKTQCAPRRLSAQLPRGGRGPPRRHGNDGLAVKHEFAVDAGIAMQTDEATLRYQFDHLYDDLHDIADLHRAVEVERLRAINRAGAREAGAEHGRDQARGVKSVGDALPEPGLGGIDVA